MSSNGNGNGGGEGESKGKKLANLTEDRAKGLASNEKGLPQGGKTPGPNYGHGSVPKKSPKKIW